MIRAKVIVIENGTPVLKRHNYFNNSLDNGIREELSKLGIHANNEILERIREHVNE